MAHISALGFIVSILILASIIPDAETRERYRQIQLLDKTERRPQTGDDDWMI